MEALNMVPYIFLILAVAGIVAGASILTVDEFGNTMTKCEPAAGATANVTSVWNGTQGKCVNQSNSSDAYGKMTPEWNATYKNVQGQQNIAKQFPTIAIIAAMVIIISLIAGVFVYMRYFK